MSITKMDANGRVLLPISIRYRLDLNDGDKFAIDQLGDGTIILKKVRKRMGFERWVNEETLRVSKDLSANDKKHSTH
jgi:AbrB family looped-hinge helix DNA binding protein